MSVCALVYRWSGLAIEGSNHRLDLEYLACDSDSHFAETDTFSVYFPVGSTVSQIKAALGAGVRERALAQFNLTIPQNEVIMPEISKV